jgi:hypothetical protein
MLTNDKLTDINEFDGNSCYKNKVKEKKKTKNLRKWLLQLIKSPWFERLSLFVIIFNCITLGMYKPCEDQPKCTSTRCFILEYLDRAIYFFFLIEMLTKILAMGFIGKNTYLAETWNILDFFIILVE